MALGGGSKVKRKDKDGNTVVWNKENAVARTPLLPKSYLQVEEAASVIWSQSQGDTP
jgi:cytidine deaminase